MPRKRAKEAEASIEETLKVEETLEAPKAEVRVPVVPRGVPVSSLAIGAKFEYKGTLYQKRDSTLTIVSGLDLKATEITKQMTWRGFPPSTLVIPI